MAASKTQFVVCSYGLMSAIVVAFLDVAGMPGGEYWPIQAIPNYGMLILCAIIATICIVKSPPISEFSNRFLAKTSLGYCLVLLLFISTEIPIGRYTLHVQVQDAKHQPIPGISVMLLKEKGGVDLLGALGLINALIPKEEGASVVTDSNGEISITASRFQDTEGCVNMDKGGGRVNKAYRCAYVRVGPFLTGKASANRSWSNASEKSDQSQMRQHRLPSFDPSRMTVVVFLPQVGGTDQFDF